MRSLSKEAEQKLISAIETAAGYVNGGLTPNDAIIKSAAESQIPAGHINLMVHAYNTGRTTTQREQGENTLEKAADFQLASADVVLDALYPKQVKTSAEIVKQQTVSTEYALSPAGMLARRRAQQEKAAAAQTPLPEKTYVPYPRDEKFAVERAYSEKRAAARAQEELRRRATDAYVKAAASMDALTEYFRTPGNMSYGDALRQVELRFGTAGVSVLKKAAAVYPAIEKQAATKADHFGHNKLYDIVDDVLNKVATYVGAYEAYSPKKADAVSKKTASEFLTGSILVQPENEPLELMKAAGPLDFLLPKNKDVAGPWPASKARVTRQPGELRFYDDAAGTPGEQQHDLRVMRGEKAKDRKDRDYAAQQRSSILDALALDEDDQQRADALAAGNQQLQDMTLTEFGHNLFPIAPYSPPQGTELDNPFENLGGKFQGGLGAARELLGRTQKSWNDAARKPDPNDKGILSAIAAPATAVAKNMGMSVGSAMGLDKKPEDVRRRLAGSLSNPEHEAELRNIRVKGTLHDLMLNDPVISGYEPAEVANAFNDISEVAPNLVESPGVLQAVLRKRLESGQLADFDLKQLLEMDKLRLERDKLLADTKQTEQSLI